MPASGSTRTGPSASAEGAADAPSVEASARGDDPALVDALLAADQARRAAVTRADGLRADQKAVSRSVKQATPDDRPAVLERA